MGQKQVAGAAGTKRKQPQSSESGPPRASARSLSSTLHSPQRPLCSVGSGCSQVLPVDLGHWARYLPPGDQHPEPARIAAVVILFRKVNSRNLGAVAFRGSECQLGASYWRSWVALRAGAPRACPSPRVILFLCRGAVCMWTLPVAYVLPVGAQSLSLWIPADRGSADRFLMHLVGLCEPIPSVSWPPAGCRGSGPLLPTPFLHPHPCTLCCVVSLRACEAPVAFL